ATHEPLAAVLHEEREALCERFATREPLAAVLHEEREALYKRFATREPLAAVLHEEREALYKRFATQEPLAAHLCANLPRLPDFSALSCPLADIHGEILQVLRDLLPVADELRGV